MADPMREYLEQRERDLETRIVGLEALLCDAQREIERLQRALREIAEDTVFSSKEKIVQHAERAINS